MFVPATPGGKLRNQLQEAKDIFSELNRIPRIKIVERGGKKMIHMLAIKDPWGKRKCMREDCLSCSSKEEKNWGRCSQEGVVYEVQCKKCLEERKKNYLYR